jgi:radical SAM superfamily enzyme YgiQ (UPF0313 family)
MIKKVRFLEPGSLPYRVSVRNLFTYDKYIRTPSTGLMTLATIVKATVDDTLMYSESISKILWDDVLDSDIVFIGVFTFNANRGYELAKYVKAHSKAIVVMGGLHASMNYTEAVNYCDYVLLGEGDESILEFISALNGGLSVDIEGIAYLQGGRTIFTGARTPPQNIDTIPNRHLLYNYHKMAGHNALWPQVHASRGCPHNCDYCAVVRHFGRCVRTRTPENVIEDIRQAIEFHDKRRIPRLSNILWLTDDNFFADRAWAISVLNAIIESGIRYSFTIQARYEVGFDDEMLSLMKKAGFIEVAMGIEFLDNVAFEKYHKKSNYDDIVRSVLNIQKHGLNVRGLFIVGAENHTKGVGTVLADFVIKYNICGVLIQSMYFIPGTPVYEENKDRLIHEDWSKYNGNVVHFPANISPADLQNEIIIASSKIYSFSRLLNAIFRKRGMDRKLFIGEYFWQKSVRSDLKSEMRNLKLLDKPALAAKPLSAEI